MYHDITQQLCSCVCSWRLVMGALTDIQIKQWVKAKQPLAKADGGRLTFTLSASGRAAWILRYRVAGRSKEKTLGQYPDISLAEGKLTHHLAANSSTSNSATDTRNTFAKRHNTISEGFPTDRSICET